ncbi:MAG: DUF4097 family beta strand repeat protein [Candidatus Cloacimonetes bacterium]|nr:DUF4097 family beta strand repeat protein [Candidatus Cloacimonadota bacterium]
MIKNFVETKTINTKSGLRLLLTSHNVGFKVQGTDSEETSIDISLELNGNIPDDLMLDDMLKVNYKEKENELTIDYKEPDHIHSQKARIEIIVPHNTMVSSKLSNGGIKLDDLEGDHNLESHNGSITISDNKGNTICTTRNGSLKLEGCKGDVEAKTRNGSVAIRSCIGRMDIDGENGSCKISKCEGALSIDLENGPIRIIEGAFNQAELKNNNGSIYYEFLPVDKGAFSFKNKNGKILLIIPEEIEFSVKAENHLGNIRIGLDGEYDREKDDDSQSIEMIKGSGKVKIDVKNQLGSIQLMKEPLQKDVHMDFSSFGDNISDIFDQIPFEEGMEKAKEAFKKVKKSFKNMNFDFSNTFENAMDTLEKNKDKIKAKIDEEIKDKKHADELKKKFKETMESVKEAFYKKETSKGSMSESRMKILDMLEKGTITSDEAERLLKALGEDDE